MPLGGEAIAIILYYISPLPQKVEIHRGTVSVGFIIEDQVFEYFYLRDHIRMKKNV